MVPSVSVIIPTYNHRDYVLQTLDSVFAQTFTDYEVIVVNDGSTDDTAGVLCTLVDSGRIIYIGQPNGGQAAARNRGLAASRGEFVAFLDDDDLWPEDKLEWQLEMILGGNYDAVGGLAGFIEDGQLIPSSDLDRKYEVIKPLSVFRGSPFISPGQVLIRRSMLVSLGGWMKGSGAVTTLISTCE